MHCTFLARQLGRYWTIRTVIFVILFLLFLDLPYSCLPIGSKICLQLIKIEENEYALLGDLSEFFVAKYMNSPTVTANVYENLVRYEYEVLQGEGQLLGCISGEL